MSALAFAHHYPTERDISLARRNSQQLAPIASGKEDVAFSVSISHKQIEFELSPMMMQALMTFLGVMAQGKSAHIIPQNAELTTVEAAEILNVSRPYLIGLLDEGQISYRKVGKHRRILIEDLLAYKNKSDQQRLQNLDELVAIAQDLGMGY